MWRTFNDDGTLTYTFIEVLKLTEPFYMLRLLGGLVFLSGMFIMLYNVIKTWRMASTSNLDVPVTVPAHA